MQKKWSSNNKNPVASSSNETTTGHNNEVCTLADWFWSLIVIFFVLTDLHCLQQRRRHVCCQKLSTLSCPLLDVLLDMHTNIKEACSRH